MVRSRCGSLSLAVLFLVVAFSTFTVEAEASSTEGDDIAVEQTHVEDNTTMIYVAPKVDGLHWAETFDGDVWSRWSPAKGEKYNGRFEVAKRKREALVGDVGLLVPEEAKHYGAAVLLPPIEGQKEVPFMVQFEVKFQEGLTCGGAYIKLFDSQGKQAADFADDTRYVIMFGPDRCGATNKIHFILQYRDPKRNVWEEKHFKEPPLVPNDQQTHLYGLVIKPDNSFDLMLDGETKKSGNFLTSLEPPIHVAKEIDDPDDHKPEGWVDEARMDDPEATKPLDWDEDAPMHIVDPAAKMPTGWNEDAQRRIPDPDAKMPADWDNDEDGEWEAPIIDNPACKVGCGKWEPPLISNPQYKGKWHSPKIDNPAFKGLWKAKQIQNPNYFIDETPYILPKIDAVGIDIWTMNKGIMFDNIVISSDVKLAATFAEQSFRLRADIEERQKPKPEHEAGGFLDTIARNGIPIAVTAAVVIITTIGCCFYFNSAPPAPTPAERRKRKEHKEDADAKDEDSTKGHVGEKPDQSEPIQGGIGDINTDES